VGKNPFFDFSAKNKMSAKKQESVQRTFWNSYQKTPQILLIIDVFLGFVMLTGVIQFLYMLIVGTFPYNSFLASFGCSVGVFVNAGKVDLT
jgi:oligosaccharyltransferase complex subunit epsilon